MRPGKNSPAFRWTRRKARPVYGWTGRKNRPAIGWAMVEEDGFEPSKSSTTDLQSAPFGHSGTPPYIRLELVDGLEPPTC